MGLSRCSTQALRALHQPSSFGAWPLAARCLWNLPEPEIEPMFPVLAGRFFTTESPGKPLGHFKYGYVVFHELSETLTYEGRNNKYNSNMYSVLT